MSITNNHPRILIVDDEPRNIRLLEGILYSEPYQLLTARSGNVALDIVQSENPDVILLDIMMPNMSGYDVCRQIKSMPTYRMIPIVMVTALQEVGDRIKAMEAGADDFLSKPIDATELIVRVRSLVRVRQLYSEVERITAERLRFMAGVAHDIRSPLNALNLNLELIAEKIPRTEEIDRLWARASTCVDRISILASDIMNYYQTEAGKFELEFADCRIAVLIQDVLDIAQPIAEERGISLQVAEPLPDIELLIDQSAIAQVLLNLLTNAIKYTSPPGEVTLRVHDLSTSTYHLPVNHYPPVLALPVEGIVFEVEDTGQGIEGNEFEQVFSEFDRLRATSTEGVGLGLPVSQRLVRLHQGAIWFSSIANEGSTFAFFLPLKSP